MMPATGSASTVPAPAAALLQRRADWLAGVPGAVLRGPPSGCRMLRRRVRPAGGRVPNGRRANGRRRVRRAAGGLPGRWPRPAGLRLEGRSGPPRRSGFRPRRLVLLPVRLRPGRPVPAPVVRLVRVLALPLLAPAGRRRPRAPVPTPVPVRRPDRLPVRLPVALPRRLADAPPRRPVPAVLLADPRSAGDLDRPAGVLPDPARRPVPGRVPVRLDDPGSASRRGLGRPDRPPPIRGRRVRHARQRRRRPPARRYRPAPAARATATPTTTTRAITPAACATPAATTTTATTTAATTRPRLGGSGVRPAGAAGVLTSVSVVLMPAPPRACAARWRHGWRPLARPAVRVPAVTARVRLVWRLQQFSGSGPRCGVRAGRRRVTYLNVSAGVLV